MGGAASTIGRIGSGVFTLGGSEIARNNLGRNNLVSQAFQVPGAVLTGGMSAGPQSFPSIFGNPQSNPYIAGPFGLDTAQLANDQSAINTLGSSQADATTALGEKQYGDTNQFIAGDAATRSAARDQLAQLLTQRAQQSFAQTLPQTAEDYNAGHLLNSSGYGNEVARQQGYLASNIANEMGQLGVNDIYNQSAQKQAALQGLLGSQSAALQGKQGFEQSSLGRGLSLEDFINQANVSKTIGAQTAPQVGNGKGQTGTLLSGVGSLAPLAGAVMGGPAGAGAGKAAGRAMGAQPLPYGQV